MSTSESLVGTILRDAEINQKRYAESIVQYTTAYPFRLHGGDSTKIGCVYCPAVFVEPKDFRSHVNEEHKSFDAKKSFAHTSVVSDFGKLDITDLSCRLCERTFIKLDAIAEHLKADHFVKLCTDITKGNLMPYKLERMAHRCGICDAKFLYIKVASRHLFTHFGRYTCELCGKTYAKGCSLASHVLHSHNAKFVCNLCRAGFDTREERLKHISGSKKCYPYRCIDCGERFYLKRLKYAHCDKVHGKKRTWPCASCDQVFFTSVSLTNHFNVTHGDGHLSCPHCKMKCPNKKRFDDHLLVHTKDRMFTCDVCLKSYPRKQTLVAHMWIHKDEKRFQCVDCDKKFNQRVSWRTHMKRYHPNVDI